MQEPIDPAHRGLSWPEAYADIVPVLHDQWGIEGEIYLSRKLSGGKSGALVYFVDISTKSFTGQAILKLDEVADSTGQVQAEAELHERAIEDAPEFAAQHLPRLLHSLHFGGQMALLSTIAGRGLEYAEPWIDCRHDRQMDAIREVSTGLLEDWNADYRINTGMQLPQELLQSWLGHRLFPEEGGRIHELVTDESNLAPDTPSFIFEGQWYPNPLAFALGTVEMPDRLHLRGAIGHCHGDFHGLNLLIGRREERDLSYYLIDLAMYESEQYLFYDHAYFELASLLFSRGESSPAEWEAAIMQLSLYHKAEEGSGPRTDDIGLIELVQTLRGGITAWIERHEADRLSFMESQTLLARVAAGLNFSHKKMSVESRQMAFFYAAANLKDFLKLARVDWVKTGPSFEIRATPDVSEDDHAESPSVSASDDVAPDIVVPEVAEPQQAMTDREAQLALHHSSSVGKFVRELRRRHVTRVAGLFIVAAWLCIQVVSALQSPLQLPEWTVTLVAMLLAIGFPFACLIAWSFEMGGDGLQRTRPIAHPGESVGQRGLLDYAIVLGILAIIAYGIFDFFTHHGTVPQSAAQQAATQQSDKSSVPIDQGTVSLAVLPFTNLNADGDDSFADGLTIEIFNVLAQTRAFKIPGMTSSFQYKDSPGDLRTIGEALNVDYLVEGTVRQDGDDLRIEANLVRADDGFLIWSGAFRETMEDVFVAQEEIALAIGAALSTPLDIDADVLEAQRTDDPEAYELFVRGLALLEDRGPGLIEAMDDLRQAVELHPNFAAAWAALSLVYSNLPGYVTEIDGEPIFPADLYKLAKEAALKAQSIVPDLPMVRHAVGNMYQAERQWAAAESAYQSALIFDPNDHRVMEDYAALMHTVGKETEALDLLQRALTIDPLNQLYSTLLDMLRWQHNPNEETIAAVEDIFLSSPSFRRIALRIIMDHWARMGDLGKVTQLFEACTDCDEGLVALANTIIEKSQTETAEDLFDEYKNDYLIGYPFLYSIGGADAAFMGYRYYGLEAPRRFQYFLVPWNLIDEIGRRSRFVEISNEMGLVDYWKQNGWPEICEPTSGDNFYCV